uniref:EF-hand domain-containing protein n=1 Tax=Brassica oleracea var. oleracea TaxID=109376 RepID=A0A0D3C417_BRAOL
MAGLTLFFSFLSLSLIISGARSRVLSPLPLNNSILISDGVHDVSDYKFLTLDPTKTLSGTECEHVYGFLPCANNVGGYVFQVLTFGCLLIVGDYFLSVGRSQLFLIFDVGFYGGIIFPLLTMFPRIVLMLANGLSLGSDVANSFVDNNVGVTAGYTVFALTIQWGACVVFRITGPSLENEERKTITEIIHYWWSQRHDIVKTIVEARVDVGTKNKKTVGVMLLSLAPFLMYQTNQKESLDHARFEIMSEVHKLLKRFSPKNFIENGEISKESIKSLFEITDTNGDGKIQISELKDFNIEFWNFGVMKCELDKHARDFLQKFDENNDGELDEEEFEKGIKDMLKKGEFKFDSVDDEKEAHSEEKGTLKMETPPQSLVTKFFSLETLEAAMKVIIGILIVVFLAKPFMMNIELLSGTAGVPSFYIVFVMIPLARNLKNTLSARFCRPKDKEKVSLHTFSEIYKDITMNNLMGMSIILAVIYARGLTWNCSVEALILVIVGLAIGLPAYMRSTYPFWICLFAFAMYICSLVLVYLRYQFLD